MRNKRMAQIYLTGAISSWDDPFKWHDSLKDSEKWSEHEFINPYTLNDFDIGDDEIYDHPDRVVEPALAEVRQSDGLLVHWDDDAMLVGSVIEAWTAWQNDIPVVIWYDGYRDDLSPWLLYLSVGNWKNKEQCVRLLLALAGDTEALHE